MQDGQLLKQETIMKTRYDSIDIAKFMGSILVFSMHFEVFLDYPNGNLLMQLFARWAVPFFFISSSFFLFRKSVDKDVTKSIITRYIYRLTMLYAAWFIYNIPSIAYMRFHGKDISDIRVWLDFLKNSVLSSTFTGSWYLVSSIFSSYVMFILSARLRTTTVIAITLPTYLLCVLSSAYMGAVPDTMVAVLRYLCFPLNIFNGLFYFAVGKYISENVDYLLEKVSLKRSLSLVALFFVIYIIEILVTNRAAIMDSTDVALSIAPLAFFLFVLCLNLKVESQKALLFRKMSTIIYCCQGNVLLCKYALRKIGMNSSIGLWFVSLIIVAFICIGVFYLQKINRVKWARYLT